MSGILFANRSSSWIGVAGVPADLVSGLRFSYSLENPDPGVLSGRAAWIFDRTAFDVQPDTMTISIPPGRANSFEFTLKALRATVTPESLPRLEFNLISGKRHYTFQREIFFLSRLEAPFRPEPAVIDGGLEDWAGVPVLGLTAAGVPEAKVRAFHDGGNLYVTAAVPTPPVAEGTDPIFRDDLQIGISERLTDTEFGPERLRLGFLRAGRAVEVKDRTPGRATGDVLPGVRGAFREDKDVTTYEIAIPTILLKQVKAKERGRLVINLSYFLPDGGPVGSAMAESKPNSFAYQVQFGGSNDLSPVHYIELFLEPPVE
jgi:hypothetical protein